MTEWGFWAGAVVLAALVGLILVRAMRRAPAALGQDEARSDLAIYKDQMAEIARDLARGTIGAEEAARLRAEVGRRVLDADRARSAAAGSPVEAAPINRLAAVAVLLALLPGAGAAYWVLGAPGYPDLPLTSRIATLDAAIAARPSQADYLTRMGLTPAPESLTTDPAAITDIAALRAWYREALLAGRMGEAVLVQTRILALLGTDTSAQDHADLALALVLEAEGYVSPEAENQLRETLRRDLGHELARYLVGEMFLQGGRFDQTFQFWRPLLESGNPEAPWAAAIRDRIQMVAELAGVAYTLPDATGPSPEDIAAAAEMAPEDRQAMIEGMVTQLSDRLASEGGDVEDWERLIRSLVVLERLAEAQTIYDEAKVRFEGRPAELSFLRLAAVESGLNP
jgi:cytochrome c-type biogenesis protein CcmH